MVKHFTLCVLIFSATCFAQSPLDFFPHHIGDMWEYFVLDGVGNDTIQDRIIFDSTDIYGFSHVKAQRRSLNPIGPPLDAPWFDEYRIDSLGNVFASGSGYRNRLHYKLNAGLRELWIADTLGAGYDIARVEHIYDDTLFGKPTSVKVIGYYGTQDISDTSLWLVQYSEYLSDGFGVVFRGGGDLGYNLYLIGAVINDQLFGDTTVVSVEEVENDYLPNKFYLFQNYPNPFNPTTTISFEIPKQSNVTLSVFDILGQEVQSLINAVQAAGRFSVDFDARELSSGIYYYRFVTAEISQTKKMFLQK